MIGNSSFKVGIYIRLSRDDGNIESDSIISQRSLLNQYIKENNYNLVDEYEVENKGRQIRVEEYEVRKTKEKRYIAEFEYKGVQYQLKGIMEKEEFDKIIKNLFFM